MHPLKAAKKAIGRRLNSALARAGYQITPTSPDEIEPEHLAVIRRVHSYTMTTPARILSCIDAVEYVVRNRLPGAVAECGVWRGGSAMAMALTLVRLGDINRDLYLFDTFEGMSAPSGADVDGTGAAAVDRLEAADRDESIWAYAPLEQVRQAIFGTGYPPDRVHLVQGRVEETLPGQAPEQISVLRLDTDWYESTKHELIHLFPRLVRGGVLLLDDYGFWRGARKAVDEYTAQHDLPLLLHRIDYTGRAAVKL
jgi:O-methyltransferase